MEIQRRYNHSSHPNTTSSGHYAGGLTIHDTMVRNEHQQAINAPISHQVFMTSKPPIIQHDSLTFLKQDGNLAGGVPITRTKTTVTSSDLPKMYLTTRDKRKSSPAVLGFLGLGDEQEAKLGQQQSQHHRNSIEDAMLLVNFTRPQTKPPSPPSTLGNSGTWKDTLSVGSNPDKKTITCFSEDTIPTPPRLRRYSFDSKMSWESMSKQFLDQASLLEELKVKPIKTPSTTTTSSSSVTSTPRIRSKTWYSESLEQEQTLQQHRYCHDQTISDTIYHTIYSLNQPLTGSNDQRQMTPIIQQPPPPSTTQPLGYYPYPYPPPSQHYFFGKLPLPNSNTTNGDNNGMIMMQPYPSHYIYPPPLMVPPAPPHHHHHLHPLHPTQQQHQHHPYQFQSHLQQQHQQAQAAMAAPIVKPKRKRRDPTDGDEAMDQVMPGDPDFPDMSERDVEAARNDVEARPRRQKLRYLGDMYTPQWVRYNGQSKEGLCDTCKPGKWLQLKNSAFWYHKQFFHGISSVSGTEFIKPMDTRWVDQDFVEGLCHQCQQWVAVSNVKRKNSVLWYRHAHKCHVYHKPKNGSPKSG